MDATRELTTRDRRRERTKTTILAAAEELLTEGGLENLTLANIAHRAAYSKPAIYEYFSGIEDILFELANKGFIQLGECVKAVPQDLPPDQKLLAAGHALVRFASENAELYNLMFTHIIFKNNVVNRRSQDPRKDTETAYQATFEIIQEGIAQGIFKLRPGHDAGMMMYACWVIVHGIASLKQSLALEMGLDIQRYNAQMFALMIQNLKGKLDD